jgi:hypothetical protein
MSTKRKDIHYIESSNKEQFNTIIYNKDNIENKDINEDNDNGDNLIPSTKRPRSVSFGDIKVMQYEQDCPIIKIDDDLDNSYSLDFYREIVS